MPESCGPFWTLASRKVEVADSTFFFSMVFLFPFFFFIFFGMELLVRENKLARKKNIN